jgi:hypothetical protein
MLALIEKHMPDEPVADPAGGTVEIVFVSAVDGKPAPGQHYYEKMEEEEKERRALQQKVR